MRENLAEAWKAIVAFFTPGLLLLGEQVMISEVTPEGLARTLIVAMATSLVVYLKRNGASPSPSTSTPQPG